jgi:hypothetical protein
LTRGSIESIFRHGGNAGDLLEAGMKRLDQTPPSAEVVPVSPDPGEAPPMLSEDQPFYDESLRASVRSLGKLIQKRRKTER